jgi:hypothetical protein
MIVLSVLLFVSAVYAKEVTRVFSVQKADGAPTSTQIPFKLSDTGVISVKVSLDIADLKNEKMFFITLHQKGNPYTLLSKYYKPGQLGVYLRHEVDVQELAFGGDYYLTLKNYSAEVALTGELLLTYPVVGESEIMIDAEQLPNLAVTNIHLDDKCKVQVTLKNSGPGELPFIFWKRDMPELTLIKDGVLWGSADIRFFDYRQGLSSVGGESLYGSGLKVIGSAEIMAVVDSNGKVHEQDESDNAKAVELICK